MRKRRLVVGLVLMLAAAACSGDEGTVGLVDEESGSDADHAYTIPTGAGEAFDRGEPLEILPAELRVRVGEIIEIVNEDDRGHLIGPFFVGAGEVLRQRFSSPGDFIGVCTVHPSGQLVLVVGDS
jgi:plastocyanin